MLSSETESLSNVKAELETNQFSNSPHAVSAKIIAEKLGVEANFGLSDEEAKQRLERGGANVIRKTGGRAAWKIVLSQFTSIIVWLLLVAVIVAWFTNNELEAVAIFTVIFLNAGIGFLIEWQAGQALEALRRETKTMARVRREGKEKIVNSVELVAGDIIILNAGDRIPADARLIEAVNFQTDESALTGESQSVEKSINAVKIETTIAERSSLVYLGTNVVAGRALAIVTAIGKNTELGRIGQLLAKTRDERTPLERRLADLGKRLVYVVLAIAFIVMLAGYLRGDNWWLMMEVSISLAVAAVPEGLPAVTTLILALGVLRMARRNAIVRRLAAVETLGSTTVICTDKTGTLTENRMTVQEYFLANGKRIKPTEKCNDDENFARLLRVSLLCNEATFHSATKDEIGDPTETALLVAVHKFGLDILEERAKFKKLHEVPFESKTKRMTTVLQGSEGDSFAVLKGSPAIVLEACSDYLNEENITIPLDQKKRESFLKINDLMADEALRVLAFADKEKVSDFAEIEDGFTFLGFVGMSDPPRTGIAEAIEEAKAAGIRIVMLTGDQISTAKAIAKNLKISTEGDVFALHGQDIKDAESSQLAEFARQAHVFARVSPEDKLSIVQALQQTGEIVAVTGDGINDAPALKQADIGIAMGERGTEVAKEAANIILTDDNFATIIKAIEGGRTIYANIIKFVHLMFSKNLAEVLVIFVAIISGLPLPLLPLQILWLNIVTDVFPALSLAVEPSNIETMRRQPRSPKESFLSARFMFLIFWQGAMLAIFALAAYFWAFNIYGEGVHSRTIALFAIVGGQLGHLFNCRSRTHSAFVGFFRNPYIFVAFAIVIGLQLFAIYFPPLALVLDIVQLSATDWVVIGLSFALPILIVELVKIVTFRKR